VRWPGKLNVIDEDHSVLLHEPAGVDRIEEDGLEAVVSVDEGEIEFPAFSEQTREDDLRLL